MTDTAGRFRCSSFPQISHLNKAAPTVNPAPTLAIKIKSPFFSFPSCRAVSIASGIVAEVVFPNRSILMMTSPPAAPPL